MLDREWSKDDRYHSTELIDGRIYHTPARFRPRAWLAGELFMRMRATLDGHSSGLTILTRGSIAMPPHDLPLPDIVLTSEPDGDGFITLRSVSLIVEVAESELDFFVGEKLRCYAKHGVPEYWVADIEARVIHQMWASSGDTYNEQRKRSFDDTLVSMTISGLTVDTTHL